MTGDIDVRTTTYVYTLGDIAMSWILRLEKIVVLSTTEAKYVVLTKACK